jgi:hypothetical protein
MKPKDRPSPINSVQSRSRGNKTNPSELTPENSARNSGKFESDILRTDCYMNYPIEQRDPVRFYQRSQPPIFSNAITHRSVSTQSEILSGDLDAMTSRLLAYRRKIENLESIKSSVTLRSLEIDKYFPKVVIAASGETHSRDDMEDLKKAYIQKCKEVEEQNRILNYYIDEVRNLEIHLGIIEF